MMTRIRQNRIGTFDRFEEILTDKMIQLDADVYLDERGVLYIATTSGWYEYITMKRDVMPSTMHQADINESELKIDTLLGG